MTETLLLPESDVENAALTPEATDESLILAAKELNASYNGHLRRSIEDFWRLGQTLVHLFERNQLRGRWADILSEIGINITTDNHARRLYRNSTIEGLAKFKNKTAALRALGILSTPSPSPSLKVRGVSSPEVSLGEFKEYTGSPGGEQISVNHEENGRARATTAERPESRDVPSKRRQAVETARVPDEMGDDNTPTNSNYSPIEGADDSLEVLAKIAARLEYLADDRIDISADHLAQIDRMLRAIDQIRTKGGAHVGA